MCIKTCGGNNLPPHTGEVPTSDTVFHRGAGEGWLNDGDV